MGVGSPHRGFAVIGILGLLALLGVAVVRSSAAAANLPPTGANLVLGSDGTLSANLTATVTNGSALRYAMDGNFTPFLDALPLNASTRATILAQIAQLEQSPILGGLFGDHDGVVSGTDVSVFASLIVSESRFLPSSTFLGSSSLGVTLDGASATSAHLVSAAFANAQGPVNSTAPIGVGIELSFAFTLSGSSHVLAIASGSPGLPSQIPSLGPTLDVRFTTPAGMAVTSTSGLSPSTTSNDPWGWGTSSVDGTYTPVNSGPVTIHFGNAFPTGDVVVAVVTVAAAAGVGALLLRRRRRRIRSSAAPVKESVGPSGSA